MSELFHKLKRDFESMTFVFHRNPQFLTKFASVVPINHFVFMAEQPEVSSFTGWDPAQPKVKTGLAWWRHQMETFSALLALCAGNSPVTGEFPSQRPVTRSFDVFFDLRLNKRLSKLSWGWWFETPPSSSWRHCNGLWQSSCRLNARRT